MNITVMCGGVGGARMARGLAAIPSIDLAIVVNVADDDVMYGLDLSPDIDTVLYTLAGIEGPHGWGRNDDTFVVLDHLAAMGEDTTFRLGDADMALNLFRTMRRREGLPLSTITRQLAAALGVERWVTPVTDDAVRTWLETPDGWLPFQEYFVRRGHRDQVSDIRFEGIEDAKPAPGVVDAIESADVVVVAPSNPVLSIWPVLAVPGIREAVASRQAVVGVSPLIGGSAVKGPADRIMASLGMPPGTAGIVHAYSGLLSHLVVDHADAADVGRLAECEIVAFDTRIADPVPAEALARFVIGLP